MAFPPTDVFQTSGGTGFNPFFNQATQIFTLPRDISGVNIVTGSLSVPVTQGGKIWVAADCRMLQEGGNPFESGINSLQLLFTLQSKPVLTLPIAIEDPSSGLIFGISWPENTAPNEGLSYPAGGFFHFYSVLSLSENIYGITYGNPKRKTCFSYVIPGAADNLPAINPSWVQAESFDFNFDTVTLNASGATVVSTEDSIFGLGLAAFSI
jgi:hypothetical protein